MADLFTSAFAIAAVTVILAAVISFFSQRKKRNRTKVAGVVSEVVIYPIKAIHGLKVEKATCTEKGLRYHNVMDRQFMLVCNNEYVKLVSALSLLKVHLKYDIGNDCLVLSAPGMADLTISLQPLEYNPSLVKSVIWYDKRETPYMEVNKKYSAWFTQYFGKEVLFVTSSPEIQREINPDFTYNTPTSRHPNSKISFAASHPYLLVHESSVDEISDRIGEQLTNQTFRGNIVISQPDKREQLPAYDEDNWGQVSIGAQAILYNERSCPRCGYINIDHHTHLPRPSKEPTTSLLKYRRGTKGRDKYLVMFGSNASLIAGGSIEVGDVVTVTYKS